MVTKKTNDKSSKLAALRVWGAMSFVLLAVLFVPLYFYWDKIAARPAVLVMVLALLGYAIFAWAKMATTIAQSIRNLPEH